MIDSGIVSGEAPQVPVISPKSGMSLTNASEAKRLACLLSFFPSHSDISLGRVFEKRLIEAYIAEHGKDPVTGEDLSADDLIDVKNDHIVRPRPPTLTSIPSLLSVFQEEWDALALETFSLRQVLAQTRQELSSALYQNDAAVRVIARVTKERDEARDALSKVSIGGATRGAVDGDAMQVDTTSLPESVVARIESTQATYVYLMLPMKFFSPC